MKAYRFNNFSGLEDLRLLHEGAPRPQRGEVLIRHIPVGSREDLQDVARASCEQYHKRSSKTECDSNTRAI